MSSRALFGFLIGVIAGDAAVAHAASGGIAPHGLTTVAHGKFIDLSAVAGKCFTEHQINPKFRIAGTLTGAITPAGGSLFETELARVRIAELGNAIANPDRDLQGFKIWKLIN